MRLLAFIIVLIACAYQPTTRAAISAEEQINICSSLGDYAEMIMEARQEGVALSHIIKVIREENTLADFLKQAMISIATKAYKVEFAVTEAARVKAVSQFKYEWLHECYSYETK
jgi:hypothetical protein